MKVVLLYTDSRGKYIAANLSKYADTIEIDLSTVRISLYAKIVSALISFHFDRAIWSNDYYRNPFILKYKNKVFSKYIREMKITNVDAVIQFGAMFQVDLEIFPNAQFFIYADGVYDPCNDLWRAPRYGKFFADMQNKMYHSTTLALTFSKWAATQLHQRYNIAPDKIVTCGWGPCLPIPSTKVIRYGKPRKLIFIGFGVKDKGVDVLIEAFRLLKKKVPDISLDVVGVEENEYPWSFYDESIHFHGRCAKPEVIKYLTQSDILVLPSRYERAGHVTIEAMSYGLPVVVTETCGAPEPVTAGKCGFVVQPGDINGLTEAIERILTNSTLFHELSENAVNEAFARWSWDKVCETMVNKIQNTTK